MKPGVNASEIGGAMKEKKFDLESRLNRISFTLFGIGMLLPWNAMLASMDFFESEFPSYKPQFSILVAVSAPMFIVQAIAFFFLQMIPQQVKVTLMFALSTIITFAIVIVSLSVDDESSSYWIVLTLSFLFGSCYAVLQAALYGLAGPSFVLMNNLNLGLGLGGLLVNVLRIIVLATVKNHSTAAEIFFFTAGAYLLFCTVLAGRFIYHLELHEATKSVASNYEGDYEKIGGKDSETYDKGSVSCWVRAGQAWIVYKRNWKEAVGVLISTTVQMAFFPGVMLESQWSFIDDFSWFVIILITFASLCDTLGRWFASFINLPKGAYLIASIIRGALFTLIYLLAFCGVWSSGLESTAFEIIALFGFASTFGYFVTIGFKHGSDESTVDQGIAGTICGFHMTLGITLGSTLALTLLS